MKVLFRKIKRSNKYLLFSYILSNIMFLCGFVFFTKSIYQLEGIETFVRIFVFVIFLTWFITYLLFGLSNLVTSQYKSFLVLTIIHLLLFLTLFFSSSLINTLFEKLEMFSKKEYTHYTTNLISLKDTELNAKSKIGMISNNEDIEGYVLANTLIQKNNLNYEVEYFDDYYTMLNSLYKEEIDAAFVSSNYVVLFSSETFYEHIGEETKVLYEYSENMKTKTNTNTNKKLTEPFTVLLMGVDSEKDGLDGNAAFNGDTLMLISFNPKTLNATMLSLPRDLYVPIACNNNRSHRINSSAAYGTDCVINTIQNLIDIKIDYYAKINFNGVIDLVNTLGGIDIDVEQPNYNVYVKRYGKGKLCESNSLRDMSKLVCMDTGLQHLNGEQTLAYARNRHGFLESDLARNRHQQQIVEAITKKILSIKSFSTFENLLDVVSHNIATNLTTTNILSFYQTLKTMLIQGLKGNDFINIQKTYLEVYNLPVMIGGLQLSALGYHENSLAAIKETFDVNLGIKEEEKIKTFSYDYNEEYTSPIIGKGITGGTKETTVPNFVGSTVKYAEEWTKNHNITLYKEFSCSENIPGLIGKQSVNTGTLLSSISSITITINESCSTNTTTENNDVEIDNNNTTPETNLDDSSLEEENDTTDQEEDSIETIPGFPE